MSKYFDIFFEENYYTDPVDNGQVCEIKLYLPANENHELEKDLIDETEEVFGEELYHSWGKPVEIDGQDRKYRMHSIFTSHTYKPTLLERIEKIKNKALDTLSRVLSGNYNKGFDKMERILFREDGMYFKYKFKEEVR